MNIVPVAALIASASLAGCASVRQGPFGPMDERAYDAASRVYHELRSRKTTGESEYTMDDPANRYSSGHTSRLYYTVDRGLRDYDLDLLSRLMLPDEVADAKSVFSDKGDSQRAPGTYVFYTRRAPGTAQTFPVSLFVTRTSAVDPTFMLALRTSVYHHGMKTEAFTTGSGFEGYLMEQVFQRGTETQTTHYILGSSATHHIIIRVEATLPTTASEDLFEVPSLAIRNLEKQEELVREAARIVLDRCDTMGGATKEKCKAEEARRVALETEQNLEREQQRKDELKRLQIKIYCTDINGMPKESRYYTCPH